MYLFLSSISEAYRAKGIKTIKYDTTKCIRPVCDLNVEVGVEGESFVVERVLGRSYTEPADTNEKTIFWLVKWEQ